MAIYKRDIASINLETGTIHRTFLNHSIGLKDQKADHFGIRVFRDGEPVDLTGVSVQGIFMPPQGDPIAITSGNIVSGNEAEVVLPQACYNYDGQFCLAIKLVDSNNSVTGTMRIVDGMVDNTHASGTVAPTSAVPTYQEILSTYDAMVAATAAANGAIAATYSSSSTYKVGDYCIHDGGLYRCTTAITTAEAWTSGHWTAAKIGPDVSDLKSAFDATINPVSWQPTLKKGEYIKGADGTTASNSKYARTNALWVGLGSRIAVVLSNTDYEYFISYYDSTGALDGTGYLGYTGYYKGMAYIPARAEKFGVTFRRADQANMTDSDITAILAALSAYAPTDTTLSIKGMSADAKAAGDKLAVHKIEYDDIAKQAFVETSGYSPTITTGKYRDLETGTMVQASGYALSNQYQRSSRCAVSFVGTDYQFSVITYHDTYEAVNKIRGYGWYESGEMVILPTNTDIFILQWHKKDGTAIASDEFETIQSGVRIYRATDKSLTMENNAADAKTTGDNFAKLNEINSRFIKSIPTKNLYLRSGGLNENGSFNSDNTRIRSVGASASKPLPVVSNGDFYNVLEPYEAKIAFYTNNALSPSTFVSYLSNTWANGIIFIPDDYIGKRAAILIRKKGYESSDISADVATITDYVIYSNPDISESSDILNATVSMFGRIGACGASWEAGLYFYGDQASDYEVDYNVSWVTNLARRNGVSCGIYARGGLNSKTWLTNANGLAKMNADDPCNLYITTFGRGNDASRGLEYLGTIEDIGTETDSYYRNYGVIIEAIKAHAPNALIIMACNDGSTEVRHAYYNATIEIAEHYDIPFVDWTDDAWYNGLYRKNNMRSDHPTPALYSGIACAFERLFSKCANNYTDYFMAYHPGNPDTPT